MSTALNYNDLSQKEVAALAQELLSPLRAQDFQYNLNIKDNDH